MLNGIQPSGWVNGVAAAPAGGDKNIRKTTPKTESFNDANFVVAGGTGGCRYDNPGRNGAASDDKVGFGLVIVHFGKSRKLTMQSAVFLETKFGWIVKNAIVVIYSKIFVCGLWPF